MYFTHFACKNQLPGFSIIGTLAWNGLIVIPSVHLLERIIFLYVSQQWDRQTVSNGQNCSKLSSLPRIISILQRQTVECFEWNKRFILSSFDESFNKVISKGQMGVLVRFWNTTENRVSSRYLSSVFVGKATAPDVLENFETASEGCNKK